MPQAEQAGPATTQPEEANGGPRHHFVWCCANSDPQMRPGGFGLTPSCGFYSVYSSKHDLDGLHVQGKRPSRTGWPNATCGKCKKKGRLNPGKRALKHFTDKNEAKAWAYTQNQRRGANGE